MLTPIKIRGRRRKTPSEILSSTENAQQSRPQPLPFRGNRKGGRPLMSPAALSCSSQSKLERRTRLLTPKIVSIEPRKSLSLLESLPVELIERVFLYSLNVNLPRSSPMLKTAVTSERVRRALVLLAFWDDSPGGINTQGIPERERQIVREGDGVIKRIMRPVDYAPLDEQERGELQSSILRCRWCTLDRILGLLPDLMNLNIQRNWVNAVTMDEGQRGALGRFLGREKKGDAREFEGVDANNRRWRLFVVPLVSITMSCEETGEVRIRRVLGVKDIPEKLLRGDKGFGEEECVLLELLRIAAGFDQSEHLEAKVTLSREALQQGIHAALIEHNTRALITVLKMDEYFARSQNVNLSDPPLYTIPAEHFRTAIRVAPSDPTLFQLLLRTSAESIPGNDPDLTQWAMDLASPLGNWILDFMLASRQQREAARTNPVEGSVFYFGRANVQGDLARRYLDEVLGVQELGSWVGETSFDVSGLWRVGED